MYVTPIVWEKERVDETNVELAIWPKCLKLVKNEPRAIVLTYLCVHHNQRRDETVQTQHLGKDKNQNHAHV